MYSPIRCIAVGAALLIALSARTGCEARVTSAATSQIASDFKVWCDLHGRAYASEMEEAKRFGIWRENAAFINAHNARHANGKESFTLALNRFGDMTNKEYRAMMLRPRNNGVRVRPAASSTFHADPAASPPAEWSWIEQGIVTPVKDQGNVRSPCHGPNLFAILIRWSET